jgi:hypothetical protein
VFLVVGQRQQKKQPQKPQKSKEKAGTETQSRPSNQVYSTLDSATKLIANVVSGVTLATPGADGTGMPQSA